MPDITNNRTITQVSIAQGSAGSTDLVAAPGAGLKIYVVSLTFGLDADGTYKFTEGTGPTDLTGVMELQNQTTPIQIGNGRDVCLQTNTANAKLSIVTVTGKANGWLRYFIAA